MRPSFFLTLQPRWSLTRWTLLVGLCGGLFLSACSETKLALTVAKGVSSARTSPQGTSYKIGKPYQVGGRWYYPREDFRYVEEGIASWYGPGFNGKRTASGEVYNMMGLTAAHRTLPMPSMVRVTNLENNRSLVVRVNDRGPFVRNRIIDVSKRAAQVLGFYGKGTARVRVKVLAPESKALKAALGKTPLGKTAAAAVTPTVSSRRRDAASIKTTASSRDVYVQAGAFVDEINAKRLQRQLQAAVISSTISPVWINGRTLYRVRVGPLYSVVDADRVVRSLHARGLFEARVVTR